MNIELFCSILVLCSGEQSPVDFTCRPTEDLAIDNDSLMLPV